MDIKNISLSMKNVSEMKDLINQALHVGRKSDGYQVASQGLAEIKHDMVEITKFEGNKKGSFLANLFRNERKEREDLRNAIQNLKNKVESITEQTDSLLEEANSDLPKVQRLTDLLINHDKELVLKISIQNDRMEYLSNELKILILRAELDHDFANSSEYTVLKKRKEQEIKSACNDLDLLKTQQIHLKVITNNLSNEEEVKRSLIDHLNNLKVVVLPTIDFSMATTIEAMKNSDALDFIQSTRDISNQLTIKSTELSQQNALKVSEIQKTGVLKLDNFQDMLKLIEKTQNEIAKNEMVAAKEFDERQKLTQKLDDMIKQTVEGGRATRAFLELTKIAHDENLSNEEMILSMTKLVEDIRNNKE